MISKRARDRIGGSPVKSMALALLAAVMTSLLVAFPLSGILIIPPLIAVLLMIRRSLSTAAATFPIVFYACSLVFFDMLALINLALLAVTYFVIVLTEKAKYITGGAITAGAAVTAVVGVMLIMIASTGLGFHELGEKYVTDNMNRPIISMAADRSYKKADAQLNKTDAGYKAAANAQLAEDVKEELEQYFLYYALGLAALAALTAFLLNRAARDGSKIGYIRLPRRYLLTVFLPVAVFSLLGIKPELRPLTAAMFNCLITVPCAVTGFTLMYYTAGKFGKIKGLITAFAIIIGVFCYINDIGLFVLSLIGFADVLIPLRPLIDIAAE